MGCTEGDAAPAFAVRPLEAADRAWVREFLASAWGSSLVVSPSGLQDASALDGFVAVSDGQPVGLVTYALDQHGQCEVVTLDSFAPGRGVGSALLDAVRAFAVTAGCQRVWLSTTNDNTAALRFYQRRGWDLVALHRDVLVEWRRLKPSMSALGHDGIPLRHALELELRLY